MSVTRQKVGDSWLLSEDGKTVLTVQETVKNSKVHFKLSGSLTNNTEHFVRDELGALATVGMDIIVDCSDLKYISNSCLLALLSVQQDMDQWKKGSLTLHSIPEDIYKQMKKQYLDELLWIE